MNMHIYKTYNLRDDSGNRIIMQLGLDSDVRQTACRDNPDKGWRWRFIGTKIPMPVRSGTWFNGFQEDTMLLWLSEHGWELEAKVSMLTGRAIVRKSATKLDDDAIKELAYQMHKSLGAKIPSISLLKYHFNVSVPEASCMFDRITSEHEGQV